MAKSGKNKAPAAQVAATQRAQKLKARNEDQANPDPGRTADEGMESTPRKGAAPSGALDAEGQRPVLERSRKVR